MAAAKPESQMDKAKRLVRKVFGVGSSADSVDPKRRSGAFASDPSSVGGKLKKAREDRKKLLAEI